MGERDWTSITNSRGHKYLCCKREHVTLQDLQEDPSLDNRYLQTTNIPPYPDSVFYRARFLCHETSSSGLVGIGISSGFQAFHENLLWFRPLVTVDDKAQSRWLDSLPIDVSSHQKPFLNKFTTSPAFQKKSRHGNFRFTFYVKELLHWYSRQFCDCTAPKLRVLDTRLYKQEIMYTILVHPRDITQYDTYPHLPFDNQSLCGYVGNFGTISWICQAPSNEYNHKLVVDEEKDEVYAVPVSPAKYFVWDHVSVAFHMEEDWTLTVNPRLLVNRATVCKVSSKHLIRKPDRQLSMRKAEAELEDFKSFLLRSR